MLVQAKLCLFHCSQFIRFSRKLFMLKVLWLLVMSEQLKAGQLSSPQSQIPSPQLLFPLVKFSQKCSLCDSKQRKKSWQLEVLTKKDLFKPFSRLYPLYQILANISNNNRYSKNIWYSSIFVLREIWRQKIG